MCGKYIHLFVAHSQIRGRRSEVMVSSSQIFSTMFEEAADTEALQTTAEIRNSVLKKTLQGSDPVIAVCHMEIMTLLEGIYNIKFLNCTRMTSELMIPLLIFFSFC